MANYDRRILIPYLYDVCCAEMLCSKLRKQVMAQKQFVTNWESTHKIPIKPHYPRLDEYECHDNSGEGAFPVALIFLGLGFFCFLLDFFLFTLLGIAACLLGAVLLLVAFIGRSENKGKQQQRYQEALRGYERAQNAYEQALKNYPKSQDSLKVFRNSLQTKQNQLTKATNLRDSIYSVNIIPKKYRNPHTAYYLYDYFSTSRESDLDKVIQTLLLDEIIKRLDKIIMQNEEVLINQRVQMALQEKSNKIASDNHREQMRAIARCERNQEIQNDYLNMIESHQKFSTYILASEFLLKS